MKSLKIRSHIANTTIYLVLTVLSAVWLLPIIWLILQSLRLEPGAYTSYIMPKGYTLNNFINLFTNTSVHNFPLWFRNTLIVAVFSCAVSTLFVLMVSYAFSRLRFPARRGLMNVVLILGVFPAFMSMVAVYHILNAINLTQSLAGLVVIYSGSAGMGYYIAKGFFDTIPKSLDEAALIDGANRNTIFWKITLPMSRPIIIHTVLTSFLLPWTDFIFASVLLKGKASKFTVTVGLYQMLSRESIDKFFLQFCAGAVIIAVPITLLFIKMQKYYVEGITGGAVKG